MFRRKSNFSYTSSNIDAVVAVASAMLSAGAKNISELITIHDDTHDRYRVECRANKYQRARMMAAIPHIEWAIYNY